MKATLRAKLVALVVTVAVSFAAITISGVLSAGRVAERMASIRNQYVPRGELRPRLEAEFERMRRSMQDAVAAQDSSSLENAQQNLVQFNRLLDDAQGALDSERVAELKAAISQYHTSAEGISRRLIAGETGEDLVDAMGSMQGNQERVLELIERTTALEPNALDNAFAAAIAAQVLSTRVLLSVGLICLVLTTLLSWWLSRGLLRSASELNAGFARFGRGEFDQPITGLPEDELGDAAARANEMAQSLAVLGKRRDRDEWIKAGTAGLAEEIRGELDVEEVGARSLRFLSRYLDAQVGALYFTDDGMSLKTVAQHARASGDGERSSALARTSFRFGEGLVGQAALEESLTLISDPPPGYLRVQSGLGESPPRAIVLLPLIHVGKTVGVLELALFKPWQSQSTDLLVGLRETLAIALQVAKARTALRELLSATQAQAERLVAQEEELRAANDELQAQQEELRQTNEELIHQTEELETERRTVEKKNRELEESRKVLEQKATELATVSAYKSQFLANMSHELRTPLNSMLLLSSLMAENQAGNLDPKQVEYCRTIHGAGNELLALINQVLDLAKVEAGKQELALEQLEIEPFLSQLRGVFEPVALAKGLEFAMDVEPDVTGVLSTDRQRITQVLNNLLGNAIKFTDRGKVSLRVMRAANASSLRRRDLQGRETLAFAVSDTGIGIAPEHRERIFEPFEQADASTGRRHGGTGLGLAIVREIAALLGGEIGLESAVGVGSTFTAYLPVDGPLPSSDVVMDRAAPRTVQVAAPERPPALVRTSKTDADPCVLVIEDDATFASSLAELIGQQGLRCVMASDGESGLHLAKTTRPSGIVLDLGLPDIHGWTVLERLRDDPATSAIPVHVVSGYGSSDRARALGAIGYLIKPAAREDLVRMLRALVPRTGEKEINLLVVEDNAITGDSLIALLDRQRIGAKRVATAEEALRTMETESFQCMVLDLSLPGMSGLELLQALEKREDIVKPAVIIYTARELSRAETQRLESYAEAVVLKEGSSMERLLDEIKLFARQLSEGLPRRQKPRILTQNTDQLRGRTILIVDDDMRTIYALSAMLRSRGAEVEVAETGRAALTALDEHPDVDGVLMDIMMPEMDGYTAMKRIREQARFRNLPIVALTAKAMRGDEEKCIEAGATAYLPKPIDPARLFEVLGTHLVRESAARG